jgi:hypothetical protein
MRDILVETARVKLAPVTLILVHTAVAMLVVLSIVEVSQTLVDIAHAIANVGGILFAAALAAALIPAGGVIFWGCNAIAVQLEHPFRRLRQYFRDHRDEKSFPE